MVKNVYHRCRFFCFRRDKNVRWNSRVGRRDNVRSNSVEVDYFFEKMGACCGKSAPPAPPDDKKAEDIKDQVPPPQLKSEPADAAGGAGAATASSPAAPKDDAPAATKDVSQTAAPDVPADDAPAETAAETAAEAPQPADVDDVSPTSKNVVDASAEDVKPGSPYQDDPLDQKMQERAMETKTPLPGPPPSGGEPLAAAAAVVAATDEDQPPELSPDGIHPYLLKIKTFSRLSPFELKKLQKKMQRLTYPPGEIVLHEGQRSDTIFVVLRGSAALRSTPFGLKEPVLKRKISQGHHFNTAGFLKNVAREASVTVLEDGLECLAIARRRYNRLHLAPPLVGGHPMRKAVGGGGGRGNSRYKDSSLLQYLAGGAGEDGGGSGGAGRGAAPGTEESEEIVRDTDKTDQEEEIIVRAIHDNNGLQMLDGGGLPLEFFQSLAKAAFRAQVVVGKQVMIEGRS